MGWRTQDAYEQAETGDRRASVLAMPRRARLRLYAWQALRLVALAAVVAAVAVAMMR